MGDINLEDKSYDTAPKSHTKMLTGFDIKLANNEKEIHVDLSNYIPKNKSDAEINQERENIYKAYQVAVEHSPEQAKKTFGELAKQFDEGISWRAPDQELAHYVNTHVLNMQGNPNVELRDKVSPEKYGEALLRLHEDRALGPLKHGGPLKDGEVLVPELSQSKLQELAATIMQNKELSIDQKRSLANLVASNVNDKVVSTAEYQLG